MLYQFLFLNQCKIPRGCSVFCDSESLEGPQENEHSHAFLTATINSLTKESIYHTQAKEPPQNSVTSVLYP
jgi:hypothetical protein